MNRLSRGTRLTLAMDFTGLVSAIGVFFSQASDQNSWGFITLLIICFWTYWITGDIEEAIKEYERGTNTK